MWQWSSAPRCARAGAALHTTPVYYTPHHPLNIGFSVHPSGFVLVCMFSAYTTWTQVMEWSVAKHMASVLVTVPMVTSKFLNNNNTALVMLNTKYCEAFVKPTGDNASANIGKVGINFRIFSRSINFYFLHYMYFSRRPKICFEILKNIFT